ncbi:MAG: 1-deoxy-D-xylulose-5-phosphate reductoisomerase [Actinomycetota bacterium]
MSSLQRVVVLGSTGSIGTQALDVIARHSERFVVTAIAAGGSDLDLLARQAVEAGVEQVAVADPHATTLLTEALQHHLSQASGGETRARRGTVPEVLVGPDAATTLAARGDDIVLNAITGAIGLAPTMAGLAAGSRLALANKESLVIGGGLVTDAASSEQIIPVDSEHSALAQCLRGGRAHEVSRLVLTASGGPFRGWTQEQLQAVTPAQALAHPTWDMGQVITTNSATLVNKGLELIEAHLLFGVPYNQIDVVVHPQSVVHSMVEFTDGSTLAQCSPPDMRLPIGLALGWPDRLDGLSRGCDWTAATQWQFLPLDEEVFTAVSLARRVGEAGGTYPAVYNAANEIAVAAFHDHRLPFLGIVDTIRQVVEEHVAPSHSLIVADVLAADQQARASARAMLDG